VDLPALIITEKKKGNNTTNQDGAISLTSATRQSVWCIIPYSKADLSARRQGAAISKSPN